MANIWKVNRDVNNETKRNNHDLSFQNHLTMKMGTLYPVFCKEVVPGDSFRINSAFGLKFMPLVFPVQSKMRAHMHFFYVRNKNLWDRWEDWIQGLKGFADGVVHPYIHQDASFFKTGTLADYLNVPTTLAVSGNIRFSLPAFSISNVFTQIQTSGTGYGYNSIYDGSWYSHSSDSAGGNFSVASLFCSRSDILTEYGPLANFFCEPSSGLANYYGTIYGFTDNLLVSGSEYTFSCNFRNTTFNVDDFKVVLLSRDSSELDWPSWNVRAHSLLQNVSYDAVSQSLSFSLTDDFIDEWNGFIGQGLECAMYICLNIKDYNPVAGFGYNDAHIIYYFGHSLGYTTIAQSVLNDVIPTPFSSDNIEHGGTAISALPFRAYESIYNAYYRDQRNQPLYIDGEIEYNRYNTTTDGGADQTPYHLFQRNYELDFLTSALPSPQQGNAPLVGMSALGTITITDPDSGDVTTAKAQVDSDGTITGLNVTSPIANREHALTLAEIASVGMNINSFRNTNALQAWLETNIRKGYRYLDFIEGHFGIRPEYRELDMPEFIGGFSRDVNVSQIVSSADTLGFDGPNSGSSLGSFNGMASCFGGSEHSITHYCDDYGFIIGILSVIPTPAYSQLLPKHFIKHNPLDYYFTEMSQLGMQPISYEEVCPVQAFNQSIIDEGQTSIHDTFGYQRPNYDLVGSVDEIHGQFRNSLSNFLINRVFEQRPQLGDDFLRIDPDETNQIFVDQAPASDNIIGQIVFDVEAKRPIPRVHMPSLGR